MRARASAAAHVPASPPRRQQQQQQPQVMHATHTQRTHLQLRCGLSGELHARQLGGGRRVCGRGHGRADVQQARLDDLQLARWRVGWRAAAHTSAAAPQPACPRQHALLLHRITHASSPRPPSSTCCCSCCSGAGPLPHSSSWPPPLPPAATRNSPASPSALLSSSTSPSAPNTASSLPRRAPL
jgi:hypothetical protein